MGKGSKKNISKKKASTNNKQQPPVKDNLPVSGEVTPVESSAFEEAGEPIENGVPGPVCTAPQVQVPIIRT